MSNLVSAHLSRCPVKTARKHTHYQLLFQFGWFCGHHPDQMSVWDISTFTKLGKELHHTSTESEEQFVEFSTLQYIRILHKAVEVDVNSKSSGVYSF